MASDRRAQAVNEDGMLKSADELKALYEPKGVTPDHRVITYGRIGERSSHTWFVLKHLLGYPDVRNHDGSWTEWGNLVRTPTEKPYSGKSLSNAGGIASYPMRAKNVARSGRS